MRPVLNVTFFCEYLQLLHDTKEAWWAMGEQFKAVKSAVHLTKIRNLLKELNYARLPEMPYRWMSGASIAGLPAVWTYSANWKSPFTLRIHKAFGRGFLRVEFEHKNHVIDENSINTFLQGEEHEERPERIYRLKLTPEQRKAVFYLISSDLQDYHERYLHNHLI